MKYDTKTSTAHAGHVGAMAADSHANAVQAASLPSATTAFGKYKYGGSPLRRPVVPPMPAPMSVSAPPVQRRSVGHNPGPHDAGAQAEPVMEGGNGWHIQTLAAAPSNIAPSSPPGLVIQCVGGPKFGMQVTGDAANGQVQAGLTLLREKQAAYKLAVRTAKQLAIDEFNAGDRADVPLQTTYTTALAAAEMTPEGLLARLDGGLTNVGDVISYNGVEIARIRRGAHAYLQHQAADVATGTAAIYKRHTLNGPSAKEYVDVGGRKLRRYAYRGITPPERLAYKSGNALRPVNHGLDAGHTGYNFDQATGAAQEREHDLLAQPPKMTDLEWLNSKAGTDLAEVPADPALRAFLQTRKGAGKLLSATSTPRAITSNHGAAFTGFGNIKIDLARVPSANILHHYKQPAFDAAALNTAVGGHGAVPGALTWETARANETVRRNRELVISEIPAAAVAELTDSPERVAYEAEYRRQYDPQFAHGYNAAIADSDLNLAPVAAPAPAVYPWAQDHFGVLQARTDFSQAVARARGRTAAQPRLEFGQAYVDAYALAWTAAFENAAWDSAYVSNLQDQLADEERFDEMGEIEINVPDAPDPGVIPVGLGAVAGTLAGQVAGSAAGTLAGNAYNG